MREIKFRQPLFKPDGKFHKFHYWGDVDGGFVSPVAGNQGRNSQMFTGLKDKSNREIYEGDIVKHPCGAYGVITWLNDMMQFGITQGWCHPIYGNPPPTESEIIGNIYENPDLLN